MSHRARRARAEAPDAAVELAAGEVRRAFEAWAARLVKLLVADYVPSVARVDWRQDATIEGLFREAGRARPRAEVLERAFTMLDKQSADELRVTGVRTADVIPKAQTRKQEWLRQNTDLIKGEADLRRRVERVLEDPLNQGRSVADIAKLLEEQAGYSTSRAVLTARDQTLKLYGQIQEERQTNAGIERYVWTTSLDERVRPDHADLDGTIQRWDDPPIVDQRTGRRGHPGFDFQCRCTAVAVLDEPAEGEAPAEQQRQVELRERAVAEGRFQAPVPPRQPPPPQPPRQPPPPERVMVPTQAELNAARAAEREQRRAEAERLRLEREADARIAKAREEAQRREAARQAAQQREIERQEAEARKLETAREEERKRLAAEAERQRAAEKRAVAEASQRQAEAEQLQRIQAARAAQDRAAAAAEADVQKATRDLGQHAKSIGTVGVVGERFARIAADTIGKIRTPSTGPLDLIEMSDALIQVPAYGKVVASDGVYDPATRSLRLSTKVRARAEPLSDRVYTTSDVSKTHEEAFARLVTHEYGHHIHISMGFSEVDNVIARAYRDAAPEARERLARNEQPTKSTSPEGAPSRYGTANRFEFWAESFTSYHHDREWLRTEKPIAFRMVQDVLKLLR